MLTIEGHLTYSLHRECHQHDNYGRTYTGNIINRIPMEGLIQGPASIIIKMTMEGPIQGVSLTR